MRKMTKALAAAALLGAGLLLLGGTAGADATWTPSNAGTTLGDDGVVTLDTTDPTVTPAGTSLETTHLGVTIETGDVVSFQYKLGSGVECGGGQPRVFIQVGGVYYNTFDGNPDQCGTDPDGDGWFTVTYTYTGPTGEIMAAGIVVDNPEDRGVIQVRDLRIDGEEVLPASRPGSQPMDRCKDGGWRDLGYRNQGACVSEAARSK